MGIDKAGLIKEREWRTKDKDRIVAKLNNKNTVKSFNQALKVVDRHKKEIVKINSILKDY